MRLIRIYIIIIMIIMIIIIIRLSAQPRISAHPVGRKI